MRTINKTKHIFMNANSIDNIQMLWLDSLHKIMSGFSARIRAKQEARSDFSR